MERHRKYLDYINDQMNHYAQLDFEKRVELVPAEQIDNILPKLASSVNLLGEQLKQKVEELHKVNEELKRQKNFVMSVMELIPSYVFVVDEKSGEVTFSNRCAVNNEEFPCVTEVVGLDKPESCKSCAAGNKTCQTLQYVGKNGESEIRTESADGHTKWYQLTKRKMATGFDDTSSNATIYSLSDITALKQNEINLIRKEEVISNSLKEKALLLQEVHHRVKNNLQIIYGLLSMQSNSTESPEVKHHLTEIQNRIYSISLIHEELYQTDNFLTIDVGNYCRKLCNTISAISHSNHDVNFVYRLQEDVKINIERATPLGLYINEVISNAYKHAFKNGQKGTITVELKDDADEMELTIKDNGPGLERGTEQFFSGSSLGSRLIRGLSQQLRGNLDVDGTNGLGIRISVPSLKKIKTKASKN